ncbi:hypothetical protein CWI75_14085 [Kineobactrum sediminis]|uniref:OmpR/PhoB-type domain-containing protein n=1 Tax=Kineobactrum sediminis TaxID=1905677 RepID=A0A2N5Y0F0_9GAMM|nr:winged helix-turn-helix domain-containing protein [Kineobactrum sediminis]PLW81868.1 hypothetical protein CWI75_14085 [Kineobactrum sediminis]
MSSSSHGYRILLVSSSDFVLGLLKGYCLSNSLKLDVQSTLSAIAGKATAPDYRLVIVDLRAAHAILTKDDADQLSYYFQLKNYRNVEVCAIEDCQNGWHQEALSNFDWVVREPIIENLEHFLSERDKQLPINSLERRQYERRRGRDRRSLYPAVHHLPDSTCDQLHMGPFSLDRNSRSLYLYERNLGLTTKEFELFELLASDNGRAFSTDAIVRALWPKNHRANKSDLYQYVHLLRRKVEADPCNPQWLLTVKGVGYRLNVESQSART